VAVSPDRASAGRIFTVAELVAGLRELLEDRVGRLWIAGEVSNLRRAGSGHFYFTLKDDRAQVRAVLFRGTAQRLRFEPEEGMEVLVYGEVTVYEERGDLQVLVRMLEPRGLGALQMAFEQLRARLEAEGLFDPAAKRGVPAHPCAVGVVTSPEGAALHDVLEVSGRRSPWTPIVISPTRVQGEGAEADIATALAHVAARKGVDVILLVRGGGSLEDLVAFNSEAVARAIRAAPVPVVAGVGHETDVTIADLAADARAPTPSAAAMLAFPDRAALRVQLGRDVGRLVRAMGSVLGDLRARLGHEWQALRAHAPRARLVAQRARLDAASALLERSIRRAIERARDRLAAGAGRLDSLSPLAVLGRGYAIVRLGPGGAVVRSPAQVKVGDGLHVRVAEGEIEATVRGAEEAPDRRRR
jgi:exodeoxyribonuclease VII large subunit